MRTISSLAVAFAKHLLVAAALIAPTQFFGQAASDSLRFRARLFSETKKANAQLENIAGFTKAEPLPLQEIENGLRRLLEYARTNRYYRARLDSVTLQSNGEPGVQEAVIYFNLTGQSDLRLEASISDSNFAIKNWQRELAGSRDEDEWRERLQDILYDFARKGYPLAAFQLDSVREEIEKTRPQAHMHFSLAPGPFVTIDSILISGNKLIKPRVLLRELPVQSGDKFDLGQVNDIPEKLMRLGYLQSVAPPKLLVDARDRYLLAIEVKEGNSNFLNGVAGYNPAAGNQKGYFTGLIDVQFNNLFGTGRAFGARWEKRGVETQELNLRYREPWIFNYPLHVSGGLQQLIQDTLYVERKWDLTLEAPWAQRFTVLASVAAESISPDSLAALRLDLPRSHTTNFLGGWRYDSRDDRLNPQNGLFFATTLAYGQKRIDTTVVAQTFWRQQVSMDFHGLIPVAGPQILSIAVFGRQVTTEEPFVSITDQIRFGGATTLRGYREDEFRGARVAWSNVEYRYLLSPRSRAFLFGDAGYYFREEPEPASPALIKTEAIKFSYGLGVRLDSALGIIGVDYGIGAGGDWLNGKVHVSLVNSF